MGASSSSDHGPSPEQQQEESLAASTGFLPALRAAFSKLSEPNSATVPLASVEKLLSLHIGTFASKSPPVPQHFPELVSHLGPSIVSTFFPAGDGGMDWARFLRGSNRCCARMPVSQSLSLLWRLYSVASAKAGVPTNLEFESDADDGKVSRSLGPNELLVLLWMCWLMSHCLNISKISKGGKDALVLPDVTHLILSAFVSAGVVQDDESIWQCDIWGVDKSISMQKLQAWVLTTAPCLVHCLSQYVQDKLQSCINSEDSVECSTSSAGDSSFQDVHDTYLLTRGRVWAISLTQRSTFSEELLRASLWGLDSGNLLYRSSIHGKGLSRFWSNVGGYDGPLIILISGNSADAHKGGSSAGRWVIGILTEQGLRNSDTFYGSAGYLFAVYPIFRVLSPSGKAKNFMYCHLHPTIRAYEPNPKPIGLAFGGTIGNERIFMDEDFARVVIRHHAVDKTYQPGSLIPNQGFLPVEASVLEVEVWGLGGKTAKEQQDAYKKRETLFSEQRRKVDLKTFTSWEDSPEKMMLDIVSDPNSVRREDR